MLLALGGMRLISMVDLGAFSASPVRQRWVRQHAGDDRLLLKPH
jgi:hypothetical protein